jgi:hypothetical protein
VPTTSEAFRRYAAATLASSKGRLIRCTVPGLTPNRSAILRTPSVRPGFFSASRIRFSSSHRLIWERHAQVFGRRSPQRVVSSSLPASNLHNDGLLNGRLALKAGLLYRKFREHYGRDDDDVLVIRASSTTFNPTLDQATIDRALVEDPFAARAEWLAEFRDDVSGWAGKKIKEGFEMVSMPPALSRRQLVEQNLGLLQIKCVKAFSEPAID